MKFASVNQAFFELCKKYNADDELLRNTNRRPYLIIIRLQYQEAKMQFALPFRSNISQNTPKDQFFPLPPRATTQPGKFHGLHYNKIFPITNIHLEKFRIDRDPYYQLIMRIINKNEKLIVTNCQTHLDNYTQNGRPRYSPDIDRIIFALTQ